MCNKGILTEAYKRKYLAYNNDVHITSKTTKWRNLVLKSTSIYKRSKDINCSTWPNSRIRMLQTNDLLGISWNR